MALTVREVLGGKGLGRLELGAQLLDRRLFGHGLGLEVPGGPAWPLPRSLQAMDSAPCRSIRHTDAPPIRS